MDARSDLFSFGCVLYEMLTGKRAFEGQNPASVIAAILEREPAPLEVARPLDRVVQRSLAKDPDQRFQTARDLKAALAWALEQPSAAPASQVRGTLPWTVAVVLVIIAVIAGAGWWRATRSVERPIMRLSVDLGPDAVDGLYTTIAVSPDGAADISRQESGRQANARHAIAGRGQAGIALGNRERTGPVLFARREMDWIFRRWKNEKDLGRGRCSRCVMGRTRRARRDLGGGRQHRRGIDTHGYTFADNAKVERLSRLPTCRAAQ